MSTIQNAQNILEQINRLMEEHSQNPSLIVIDILQEKTRFFYEELNALKQNTITPETEVKSTNITTVKETPKKEPKEEIKVEEKIEKQAEKKIDQKVKEKVQEKQPEIKEVTKKEVPPIVEQKEAILKTKKEEEKPVVAEKEAEVKTKKKVNLQEAKETIADSFTPKKSMNDLLSEIKQNTDLATQLQNRPIQDLKNAISLNDKIWFIKELFSGDADKYNAIIETINKVNSSNEAIQIIEQFSWDKEQSSTKRFIELIYRKFIS